jgi:hypothetical protein
MRVSVKGYAEKWASSTNLINSAESENSTLMIGRDHYSDSTQTKGVYLERPWSKPTSLGVDFNINPRLVAGSLRNATQPKTSGW